MFKTVDLDDRIAHLFVFDIDFCVTQANAKILICNEPYTLIFEKDRALDPSKRSVLQLSATLRIGRNDEILSCNHNLKSHATMLGKKSIRLCLEHLSFLVKRRLVREKDLVTLHF